MADDEMAVPNSSGDDYNVEETSKGKNEGEAITMTKRNRFTCFDVSLIVFLIGLTLTMLLLKYRNEMLGKEKKKISVRIKVMVINRR